MFLNILWIIETRLKVANFLTILVSKMELLIKKVYWNFMFRHYRATVPGHWFCWKDDFTHEDWVKVYVAGAEKPNNCSLCFCRYEPLWTFREETYTFFYKQLHFRPPEPQIFENRSNSRTSNRKFLATLELPNRNF